MKTKVISQTLASAMAVMTRDTAPSPFVVRCLNRVRGLLGDRPAALDVAMGDGRHTVVLAQSGSTVFGVDRDHGRQSQARRLLAERDLSALLWTANLEEGRVLPARRFDLVVCTRYLQRNLWSELVDATRPGGFVIYETFTTLQRQHNWGPRSPDHLLEPGGELRRAFEGLEVWEYEESETPAAEARLLARRR